MRYLLLALFIIVGCTETRSDKQADTIKKNTLTIDLTATVPTTDGIIEMPIAGVIEHVGSEQLVEHSESKTQIDANAIAQQVGAVVGKSFDAAIAKITGFQMKPGSPITPTETGLASGLAAAALLAMREMMAKREEARRHQRTIEDRNQLRDRTISYAEKMDPNKIESPARVHA